MIQYDCTVVCTYSTGKILFCICFYYLAQYFVLGIYDVMMTSWCVATLPILPDDLHYVERSGMVTGTGVKIDTNKLFTLTSATYTPNLMSMMKIEYPEDFVAI